MLRTMFRVLLMLAYLALVVCALVDAIQSDEEDSGGIQKGFWILIILFLPLAGSIAWLVVSRSARTRRRTSPGPTTGFPASPPPAAHYPARRRTWDEQHDTVPDSPDDDPELHWLLEQARLQRKREQRAGQTDGGGGTRTSDEDSDLDGEAEPRRP